MFRYFIRLIRKNHERKLREKIMIALLKNPNHTPDFAAWRRGEKESFALPTYTPSIGIAEQIQIQGEKAARGRWGPSEIK